MPSSNDNIYQCTPFNFCFYPLRLAVGVAVAYFYLWLIFNPFLTTVIRRQYTNPATCKLISRMKENRPCFRTKVTPNATGETTFSTIIVFSNKEFEAAGFPKEGQKVSCFYAAFRSNYFVPGSQAHSARPSKGRSGLNAFVIIIAFLVTVVCFGAGCFPCIFALAMPPLVIVEKPSSTTKAQVVQDSAKSTGDAKDKKCRKEQKLDLESALTEKERKYKKEEGLERSDIGSSVSSTELDTIEISSGSRREKS